MRLPSFVSTKEMAGLKLENNWIERKLEYDCKQYTKLISYLTELGYKENLDFEEQFLRFEKLINHLASLARNESSDCFDFESIYLEDICERLYPNWLDGRKCISQKRTLSHFLIKYQNHLQKDISNFFKGIPCTLVAPKKFSMISDVDALKRLITEDVKVEEEARKFVYCENYDIPNFVFGKWSNVAAANQKALKLRTKRNTHYYRNELKKVIPEVDLIRSARLGRMSSSQQYTALLTNFHNTLASSENNFLLFDKVGDIGWGCYTLKKFLKGDLLLEYKGERVSRQESDSREKKYAEKGKGCYRYCFRHDEREIVIDPTMQTIHMARYCNHSKKNANAKMETRVLENVPRAFLFATKEILVGEEILWDYGDRNKEVLLQNPWLCH